MRPSLDSGKRSSTDPATNQTHNGDTTITIPRQSCDVCVCFTEHPVTASIYNSELDVGERNRECKGTQGTYLQTQTRIALSARSEVAVLRAGQCHTYTHDSA